MKHNLIVVRRFKTLSSHHLGDLVGNVLRLLLIMPVGAQIFCTPVLGSDNERNVSSESSPQHANRAKEERGVTAHTSTKTAPSTPQSRVEQPKPAALLLEIDQYRNLRQLDKANHLISEIDPAKLSLQDRISFYYLKGCCAEICNDWRTARDCYLKGFQISGWDLLPIALKNLDFRTSHDGRSLTPLPPIDEKSKTFDQLLALHLDRVLQPAAAKACYLLLAPTSTDPNLYWALLMDCPGAGNPNHDEMIGYARRCLALAQHHPITQLQLQHCRKALASLLIDKLSKHNSPHAFGDLEEILRLDPPDNQLLVVLALLQAELFHSTFCPDARIPESLQKLINRPRVADCIRCSILQTLSLYYGKAGDDKKAYDYGCQSVGPKAGAAELHRLAELADKLGLEKAADKLFRQSLAAPSSVSRDWAAVSYAHWLRLHERYTQSLQLLNDKLAKCDSGQLKQSLLKEKFLALRDSGLADDLPETGSSTNAASLREDGMAFGIICAKDPVAYMASLPKLLSPRLNRRLEMLSIQIANSAGRKKDDCLLQRAELHLISDRPQNCLADLDAISLQARSNCLRWYVLKIGALTRMPSTPAIEDEKTFLLGRLPVKD